MSVTGDIDDNSTAGTTGIAAGYYYGNGTRYDSTSTYAVSGNVNIASGASKAVYLQAVTGVITLPSTSLSLASFNIDTYNSNSGITLNGNVATTGLINIQTGGNSNIALNGSAYSSGTSMNIQSNSGSVCNCRFIGQRYEHHYCNKLHQYYNNWRCNKWRYVEYHWGQYYFGRYCYGWWKIMGSHFKVLMET